MTDDKSYFKLFSNCQIVKGYTRSLICDTQFERAEIISNDFFNILEKFKKKIAINDVINFYGSENKNIILEYLDYLIENKYGFLCDHKEFDFFPEIKPKYITPYKITNSIIEIKPDSICTVLEKVLPQLDNLGCKNIHIIAYDSIILKDLYLILDYFNESIVKSLELTLKYNDLFVKQGSLRRISKDYKRVTVLTFFDAPKDHFKRANNDILFNLQLTKKNISSFKHCGIVDKKYFTLTDQSYYESLKNNSCLNKKISIDLNFNIKNCPSMPKSFGNILETSLEDALSRKDFKRYWNINKDQIDICRDCEFRHVCTDCRAYLEDPSKPLSKPLKCGYDPYKNKWMDWSTNPLKKKAIDHYKMQSLIKENEK